jgi:type I restriction-modification system DNA methylase subunit
MLYKIEKEELLNFIYSLYWKLKNFKGLQISRLTALNEIENILFFRLIEERKKIKGIQIKFTKFCELYATDNKIKDDIKIPLLENKNYYKLWNEFYNISNKEKPCILQQYYNNDIIKKYISVYGTESILVQKVSIFTETNKLELLPIIQLLFNMIYNKFKNIKFDSNFYEILGSVCEEFKTSDIINDGKHICHNYTPISIKKIIINELNVKSNEIYYEPSSGTGGFIYNVHKYVKEKEGEKACNKFIKNIYTNEYNSELVKSLMINMLLQDILIDNISNSNPLGNENILLMKQKADVIGTNFPFGVSTNINLYDYTDKQYWNPLVKHDRNRIIKNSTGLYILHIYNSLKENGRTGFVSDRKILMGGETTWENTLRKFIIKNTNLYKILLLPAGIFPFTYMSTCIIFFKKGEVTKEVKIYDCKFTDEKNKTDLYIEPNPVKIFTLDELVNNGYSFKLEENKEIIQKGWINFGDIVKFNMGKNPLTNNINYWNGDLKWVSISELNNNVIFETNKKITEQAVSYNLINKIIKGSTLMSFKTDIGKFAEAGCDLYCCEEIMFFKHDNIITHKFITYYLKFTIIEQSKFLIKNDKYKVINKKSIFNLIIPSLILEHQREIVDLLDKQFQFYDINLLKNYIKDLSLFNLLIEKKYKLFEDALHLYYRNIELTSSYTQIENDIKTIFNIKVNNSIYKEYNMREIVHEIKTGKNITNEIFTTKNKINNIPFYRNNVIVNYTNTYLYEGKYILVCRGGTFDNIIISDDKFFISDHTFVFLHKNNIINLEFLFLYLKYCTDLNKLNIYNGKNGIHKDILFMINVLVPSLEDQEKIIKDINKIKFEQSLYVNYIKLIQDQIDSISQITKKYSSFNNDELNDVIKITNNDIKQFINNKEKIDYKSIKEEVKKVNYNQINIIKSINNDEIDYKDNLNNMNNLEDVKEEIDKIKNIEIINNNSNNQKIIKEKIFKIERPSTVGLVKFIFNRKST